METKLFVVTYEDYFVKNTLIIEAENGLSAIGIAREEAVKQENFCGTGENFSASEIIKKGSLGILHNNP